MLFEKLTADELKIIEIMRKNGVDSDSDFFSGSFVDNQTFLRFWEEAKTPMIEAFGDRLIMKKPLNTMVEDDELYEKMNKVFIMDEYHRVRKAIIEHMAEANGENWEEFSIPSDRGHRQSLYEQVVYHLFTAEEWISNRYNGLSCEIKIGDGNVLKLVRGCKVMKVLGRMAKACGDSVAADFEILRLRQSQVLNEARINANLCISIHPLDYMTASYNANDWRSCMNWEDGEYRRGVIEMMNSPMVVVAYIESRSTVLDWYNGHDMPRLEWNSKRWREFFIVRPDMISGIKGYPYWNRTLEDETIDWLTEIFAPVFKTKYAPIMEWRVDCPIQDEKNDIDTLVTMDCGPAMYNDFYSDNDYHTRFAVGLHGKDDGSYYDYNAHTRKQRLITNVFYSGESECIVCGEPDQNFDSEGDLSCTDCVEHIYCAKCGDEIFNRNDVYEVDGRYYCPYCYENLDTCDICDERIDTDNGDSAMKFVISLEDQPDLYKHITNRREILHGEPDYVDGYSRLLVFRICGECAKEVFKGGEGELYTHHASYEEDYRYYEVVPLSHLTDYGIAKLLDPKDIEYSKARNRDETLSA